MSNDISTFVITMENNFPYSSSERLTPFMFFHVLLRFIAQILMPNLSGLCWEKLLINGDCRPQQTCQSQLVHYACPCHRSLGVTWYLGSGLRPWCRSVGAWVLSTMHHTAIEVWSTPRIRCVFKAPSSPYSGEKLLIDIWGFQALFKYTPPPGLTVSMLTISHILLDTYRDCEILI